MMALTTKRAVTSALARQADTIATGLRVRDASDNAAYWSISTTMRSDNKALSAVMDAIGLASSKVDVAYSALVQTISVLDEVKAKLVSASSDGADRQALQQHIAVLAEQTVSIAKSASFAGSNWLNTSVEDMYEGSLADRSVGMVTAYSKTSDGQVKIGTTTIDLGTTSLYNANGGGLLQADPRSPETIGGVRWPAGEFGFTETNQRFGTYAMAIFNFTEPMVFNLGNSVTFDIIVDADNPNSATNGGIPGPYDAGAKTESIVIDRALVDAVLPGKNGVVSDYQEMISVLSRALSGSGAIVTSVLHVVNGKSVPKPDVFCIRTLETSRPDGSGLSIVNHQWNLGTGIVSPFGTFETFDTYGTRGSSISLSFTEFKVYKDVEIDFDFGINGAQSGSGHITRELVDTLLGTEDGWIRTADQMATILEHLVGQPGLMIATSGSTITLATDPASDRMNGNKSRIGFTNISVNVEPLARVGLLDIDIVANPAMTAAYLNAVEAMISKVTDGASKLGAVKNGLEMRRDFTSALMGAIERGISQLVDADMERASLRLKALQVQDQLATQALSIANGNSRVILDLFT